MKNLFLAAGLFIAFALKAQPGTLDSSFGHNGKMINTAYTGDCQAVLAQHDGKIITAGMFSAYDIDSVGILISRFNIDGSVDASFGNSGKVIISKTQSGQGWAGVDVAIQADQKILAYGLFTNKGRSDIGVVRLNTNGSYDTNFGDSGVVVANIGLDDRPGSMVLQQDEKILITGNKGVKQNQTSPGFIIRYMPDGSLDESFGTNGITYTQLPTIFTCKAIAATADNGILIGGTYHSSSTIFAVLKYKEDGFLDESFGVGGIAKLFPQAGNFSNLNDLALQEDGKILATGEYGIGQLTLARFDASGKVDSSFGKAHTGYITFLPEEGYAKGKNVYLQNPSIIVTGIYSNTDIYTTGPNTGFGAFAFKLDGTFDSSFGENGVASTGFDAEIFTMETGVGALAPDGKIVVGGAVAASEADDFFNIGLVRFNGNVTRRQILITKIRRWLQHHNGIMWDDMPGAKSYAVQRSRDGVRWTTIHSQSLTANGNRSAVNYYNDPSPSLSSTNYRVQTTSADGTITYSNVLAINHEPSTITLSPNPAKNSLRIEGLPSNQNIKLTVVDLAGNVAISQQLTANSASYNLNVNKLKPGNYLLRIETADGINTKQFVKE